MRRPGPEPVDARWVPALLLCLALGGIAPRLPAAHGRALSVACLLLAGLALFGLWLLRGRRSPDGAARNEGRHPTGERRLRLLGRGLLTAAVLAGLAGALVTQTVARERAGAEATGWHAAVDAGEPVRIEASLAEVPREESGRHGDRWHAPAEVHAAGHPAHPLDPSISVLLTGAGPAPDVAPGATVCAVGRPAQSESGVVLRLSAPPVARPCSARSGASPREPTAGTTGAGGPAPAGDPESARGAPGVVAPTGRDRLREAFRDASRGTVGHAPALIPGMVLGDRSGQGAQLEQDMEDAGLSHLTAVSGANCALLLGAVALSLRSMRAHRAVVLTAGLGALGVFVLVVGPEPSVLRAAVMGALGALAVFLGRGRQAFSLLTAGATLLLVVMPALAVEVAFHLSLAATAGIVLVARPLDAWLHRGAVRVLPGAAARWLSSSLAVTGAAHVACQPILLAMTGTVSPWSVPANLAAAPAVAPVTVLGTLAAALVLPAPGAATALLQLVQWPAAFIGWVGSAVASWPGAVRPWPEGPIGTALGVLLTAGTVAGVAVVLRLERTPPAPVRRRGRSAPRRPHGTPAWVVLAAALTAGAMGTVGAVVVPRPASGVPESWAVAFCDVGQGDMAVFAAGGGSAVVVDIGPEPDLARRCLEDLGVRRVAALLLTHLHADHAGGLPGLTGSLAPERLLVATRERAAGDARDARGAISEERAGVLRPAGAEELATGGVGTAGAVTWRVLLADARAASENDASAQLRLTVHTAGQETTVLVTGDMEAEASRSWTEGLRSDAGPPGRVDVLKVAHHGARNGGTAVPEAVRARVHVISVGADNEYGHPHPSTVAALERIAPVARTDLHGTLAFVPGPDGSLVAHTVRPADSGGATARRAPPPRMVPMPAARSPRTGRGGRAADPLAWRRAEPGPLMLLRGPEDYAARWVTERVVEDLRRRHGSFESHQFRAGEYQAGQLAMAASPSLFAEPTLIRVDGLEAMNDAFLEDALRLVQQGPGADDVTVVLRHTGGNRGKRLLDAVAKAGTVVECQPLKTDEQRLALVQAEFREARRRIDEDAARALVRSTGASLTDLAAATRQLIEDVTGTVTVETVETYYGGRVEATSFAVADAALEGQAARAVSLVRHALATGVHPVMVTSALALKARQVARLIDSRLGPGELAAALGVAPFQVRFVQQAARHWSPAGIAQAIEWIAQGDAEVKGGSRNAEFAVERTVIRVATGVRR